MNKNAIKKFAVEARKKLIASVSDKAGMLGITPERCSEPVTKGTDFEVYKTIAETEVTLSKTQCEQRRKLKEQVEARGFEAVVEEVAYTWFNRICAIRFMEVNDYLPTRVRVLSSEKEGKNEPDIVTQAPDVDLDFTDKEREYILDCKINNKLDELFKMLFIKQCNKLSEILPELFEATEDYTEMLLNISYTNKDDIIYMLVNQETGIPEADFNVSTIGKDGQPTGQVEIIGWLYQYYNTELNEAVYDGNMSKSRISKELLPAATTIYTPDWPIRYMVENTLGRIWIEHILANGSEMNRMQIADSLGWKYYIEAQGNTSIDEIKRYKDIKPTEIKCLDTCMGSGHILIAMFDLLMDIYKNAGYSERDAAEEIVKNNLYGLDIDKRAYQLSYFAVMMKGRGYNRRFLQKELERKINLYEIVESNEINTEHINQCGGSLDEQKKSEARTKLLELLGIYKDAKEYGSILLLNKFDFALLEEFVNDTNVSGQISFNNLGIEKTQKSINKLIRLAKAMSEKYDVVITNPPYLGNTRFSKKLNDFVAREYSNVKNDLSMIMFKKVIQDFSSAGGQIAFITTSSWMFLSRFEAFREQVINNISFSTIVDFGTELFDGKVGHNPITAWTCMNKIPDNNEVVAVRLVDFCFSERERKQIEFFNRKNYYHINQEEFKKIPGMSISYWLSEEAIEVFEKEHNFDYFGTTRAGMITGNNDMFIRLWQEVSWDKIGIGCRTRKDAIDSKKKWFPYNKGGEFRKWYGNNSFVVNWENDGFTMRNHKDEKGKIPAHAFNLEYIFDKNITWNAISFYKFSARFSDYGFLYDASGSFADIKNEDILYLLGLLCSSITDFYLSAMNPTMNFQKGNVSNLPIIFDMNVRNEVENLVQECIDISKADWDSFETSWDFKKHPLVNGKSKISEAMEDWKNVCSSRRMKLKENETKINEIFVKLYGLDKEVNTEVDEKDIMLHCVDEQEEIKSLLSYAVGCILGRYSLKGEGLVFAGGEWKPEQSNVFSPDVDNIIPITQEEYFGDDIVGKVVDWLRYAFGEINIEDNLQYIAERLGNKGESSREAIRHYFLNDFFKEHCSKYSMLGTGKRPIYWLFDSGKQNGFKALMYIHRYDENTVGRMRVEYLHKTQEYIENAMKTAEYIIENSDVATERAKATRKITLYTKQLAEIKIYDEAVAHIANKRIKLDLDDGVKVNYAKFQGVEVAQEGKKAIKVDLLAKI